MKRFAAALGILAATTAAAQADIVTDWNQTAIAVMKAANVGGNPASRTLAMVHVAMADAVNSVQGRYARYLANLPVAPSASAEAAASAAARQVLVQLYPNQKAIIDEAHAASSKAVPDVAAKSEGVAVGEQIAAAVHADRAGDGTNVPDTYRPLTSPGVWVPTTTPIFAEYARAKPWVLKSADQFRPGPPPPLSSALYARGNEATERDPGWTPQNATPMHPEYPSQAAIMAGVGAVAEVVGIWGGVVSGVLNPADSGVGAPEWRPRHDERYHVGAGR